MVIGSLVATMARTIQFRWLMKLNTKTKKNVTMMRRDNAVIKMTMSVKREPTRLARTALLQMKISRVVISTVYLVSSLKHQSLLHLLLLQHKDQRQAKVLWMLLPMKIVQLLNGSENGQLKLHNSRRLLLLIFWSVAMVKLVCQNHRRIPLDLRLPTCPPVNVLVADCPAYHQPATAVHVRDHRPPVQVTCPIPVTVVWKRNLSFATRNRSSQPCR